MDNFKELLAAFKPLYIGQNEQAEQTYMQVSGYSHYENVCSNLLQFFLNSEETHGFGKLFVESLLDCLQLKEALIDYSTDAVDREYSTERNKRIDIFFETETHVVGIENKIYSPVNNDLLNYQECIENIAKEKEKVPICILLSIDDNSGIVNETAFVSVTYSKFINKIKANIGKYLVTASTKWIVFLNDFIKTLEDLHKEETKLEKELLTFFGEYWEEVENLITAQSELDKYLKDKVKRVSEIISESDLSFSEPTVWAIKRNYCAECYFEFSDSKQKVGSIEVGAYIDTDAWYIVLGFDTISSRDKYALYLKKAKVKSEIFEKVHDYSELFLQLGEYDIYESEKVIADKLLEVLRIVQGS